MDTTTLPAVEADTSTRVGDVDQAHTAALAENTARRQKLDANGLAEDLRALADLVEAHPAVAARARYLTPEHGADVWYVTTWTELAQVTLGAARAGMRVTVDPHRTRVAQVQPHASGCRFNLLVGGLTAAQVRAAVSHATRPRPETRDERGPRLRRVSCDCGWTLVGTADEVTDAVAAAWADDHDCDASREPDPEVAHESALAVDVRRRVVRQVLAADPRQDVDLDALVERVLAVLDEHTQGTGAGSAVTR